MQDFTFNALPWRIVFGAGSLQKLPHELKSLGLNDVLVLSTAGHRDLGQRVCDLLGEKAVGLFAEARMHVPAETLEAATEIARSTNAKCTVSIGGGSTTGLGKALAAKEDLPNIAIPTTYAGSEMTDIWAVTEAERKVTARAVCVVPRLIIYDPELTTSLPAQLSAVSGLNAMAQAVVNVATDKPNPIVSCLALDGIRALARSLPVVVNEPSNLEARGDALYGASLAAAALGTGATSLHHKLCHTFGGTFNTPHAETHAILLPHSVAYNTQATPVGSEQVAKALGATDAARGIHELAKQLGAPTKLSEIGIKEPDLDEAARIVSQMQFHNPEPVTQERVSALLQRAYVGEL